MKNICENAEQQFILPTKEWIFFSNRIFHTIVDFCCSSSPKDVDKNKKISSEIFNNDQFKTYIHLLYPNNDDDDDSGKNYSKEQYFHGLQKLFTMYLGSYFRDDKKSKDEKLEWTDYWTDLSEELDMDTHDIHTKIKEKYKLVNENLLLHILQKLDVIDNQEISFSQ